jgi:hypothetical protein
LRRRGLDCGDLKGWVRGLRGRSMKTGQEQDGQQEKENATR